MSQCIRDVGVVIAAFNASATIGRAVKSALREDEVSEIIVVDDGSTDATADAAFAAANGDTRLTVLRQPSNGGPSAARNRGFGAGSARFVAILDADDEFLPGRLRAMPDGEWDLFADNMIFLAEGDRHDPLPAGPARIRPLTLDEFLASNISSFNFDRPELGYMKAVIRRAAIERLSLYYDETVQLGEDYLLYARALAQGGRAMLSSHIGYRAFVSTTSLSWQHRTEDLVALRAADSRLLDLLADRPGSAAQRELVRRHQDMVARKIDSRRFLDVARQRGRAAAIIGQLSRPFEFGRITADILRDRARHSQAPARIRTLLVDSDFEKATPQAAA